MKSKIKIVVKFTENFSSKMIEKVFKKENF